jgi:hypothetical protein
VPAEGRKFIEQRMEDIARFTFNLQYKSVPMLGGESVASFFFVDGGRNKELVQLVRQAQYMGGEAGREVAQTVGRMLARSGDERAARYVSQLFRAQQPYFRTIPERIDKMPMSQTTRDALIRATWSTVSETGSAVRLTPQQLSEMGETGTVIREAQRVLFSRKSLDRIERGDIVQGQEIAFQAQLDKLIDVARRNGDDAQAVADIFKANVDDAVKASAVTSYYTSLHPYLREEAITQPLKWLENLKKAPGFSRLDDIWAPQQQQDWATRIWRDALHEGMLRGQKGLEAWYDTTYGIPRAVLRQLGVKPGTGPAFNARDVFREFEAFSPLKPGEYLQSLMNGHLRRTYAAFQSPEAFEGTMRSLRSGALVMKNIVEDATVLPAMESFNKPVTDLARQYFDMVTPLASGGRPQGIVVRQEDLMRHLTNNGVDANDAMSWMRQFVKEANPQAGGGVLSNLIDEVTAMWGAVPRLPTPRTQITPGALAQTPPGGTPGVLQPRTIEASPRANEFMAALGEVMDPAVSLLETAAASERLVGTQMSLKRIMDFASKNPQLVKGAGEATPTGWIRVPDSQFEQYAAIAGKSVHPVIYREINNLMSVANRPNDFFRAAAMLRSMVTGGYLANPATTTVNAIGGFATAALYGQNPITLAREMLNVHNDLKKYGRKLPDLQEAGFLIGNTVVQSDIYKLAPELAGLRVDTSSQAVQAVKNLADNIYSGYQEYVVRRPGGIGALGLEPFEMIETSFRIAAYRLAKQSGKTAEEAGNFARFIVFDYAAQPGIVRLARDTGIFLFPAFPYFMFGRTMNAAMNRPGVLGAFDRLSEAVWNANVPNEEERLALWGAQEDFMKRDRFVPLWSINDAEGNARGRQFMSMNQLFPTNTLTGAGYLDSLEEIGLLGPLYDLVANGVLGIGDSGEGTITGQSVFRPTDSFTERVGNLARFAYRNFAPGFARKLYTPTEVGLDEQGLVPAIVRSAFRQDDQFGETMYSMNEALSRRVDRGIAAEAWSFLVRGTRAVVADGPGQNLSRPVERARREVEVALGDLRERAQRAQARGDVAAVERYRERAQVLRDEWVREWGPYVEMAKVGREFYGGQQ